MDDSGVEPVLDCRWARKVMDMDSDTTSADPSGHREADDPIQNRPYQDEMVDRAKVENIICALGTGMGKTQVALSVIKELLYQTEPPWDDGGKRSIMVVPTVPLVEQQKMYIQKWIPSQFQVAGYHGLSCELTVEFWNKELQSHSILVMVHDILKDLLHHSLIEVSRINLLIFDECHHGGANHSYREIMRFINDRPRIERPRVLGLTASIINCKLKRGLESGHASELEMLVKDLELCFGAKVCTSVDQSINDHESSPTVLLESFKISLPDEKQQEAVQGLSSMVSWIICAQRQMVDLEKRAKLNSNNLAFNVLKDEHYRLSIVKSLHVVKYGLTQLERTFLSLGPWCAYQTARMIKRDLELMLKNSCFNKEMMAVVESGVTQVHLFGTLLEQHYNVQKCSPGGVSDLLEASSLKLRKLVEVLRKNRPRTTDTNDSLSGLRCIIFVAMRFDAWALHKFLEFLTAKPGGEFAFLKSGYLVGQQLAGGSDSSDDEPHHRVGLSYKQACATLAKFRRGDINVMVATSVVEEGLDVPDCNLIIRFDKPEHYRSYLQSKGRARAKKSKFIVLTAQTEHATVERELKTYGDIDNIIKKTCITRAVPGIEEQKKHFQEKPGDKFSPPNSSATVSLSSAIAVLQRYFSTLSDDRNRSIFLYGKLLECANNTFAYRIYMPLSSVIKQPVTGREMESRKLAKQSAALECCRILYGLDQLDDHLLPKMEQNLKADLKIVLGENGEVREKSEDGSIDPGTRRRRQYYAKNDAKLLLGCRPVANEPLYLYHVLAAPVNGGSQYILTKPGPSVDGVGLLSRVPLPSIPIFSVFYQKVEFHLRIILMDSAVTLNAEEVKDVQMFHTMMYENVTRFYGAIAMSFKPDVENGALYSVPLLKNMSPRSRWEIDWNVVRKVNEPSQFIVVSQPDEKRQRMNIFPEAYRDGVVTRWYKKDDDRFYVLNISKEFTPMTPYPIDEFANFSEYFERKHGIEIQQPNQPMLETKYCGRQLNLLTKPVVGQDERHSSKSSIRRDDDMKLVPELCQLFPFPASLYQKCLVFPSVIHRIYWYCMVYDLRERIKSETGIGMFLEDPVDWARLTYHKPYTKVCTHAGAGRHDAMTADAVLDSESVNGKDLSSEASSPVDLAESTDDLPDDFSFLYSFYLRNRHYALEESKKRKASTSRNGQRKRRTAPVKAEKSRPLTAVGCSDRLVPPPFLLDESFRVDAKKVPFPDLNQLLTALVTSKAGDGFDLERLEVIGDSFLKMTACIHLYFRFPQHQEGRLTQLCNYQVSNYNMYRLAKKSGIQNYILNQRLEPLETFIPPGFVFDEEESNAILANSGTKAEKFPSPRIYQAIDDKTVADAVEALIGAFTIYSSSRSAQLFMSWIGLTVLPEIPTSAVDAPIVDRYGAFDATCILNPVLRSDPDVEFALKRLTSGFSAFEEIIGYKFANPAFLLQAFTHSSFNSNDVTDCYERLEYLGDAVLDYLVTRIIFENSQNFSPGLMSDMRSALVNNRTFATLAVKFEFHKFIEVRNGHILATMEAFADEVAEKKLDIVPVEDDMLCTDFDDEKKIDEDEAVYEQAETPKILGDVFEAVAGAIFLDSGLSFDAVWRVYYTIMRPNIEYVLRNCPRNPIRELIELEGGNCIFEKSTTLENGRCLVQVTVLGKGTFIGRGNNIRAAKANASINALNHLKLSSR